MSGKQNVCLLLRDVQVPIAHVYGAKYEPALLESFEVRCTEQIKWWHRTVMHGPIRKLGGGSSVVCLDCGRAGSP